MTTPTKSLLTTLLQLFLLIPAWCKKSTNIILILADDMGKECIGAYGSTYQTPNIDALAKTGLKFNYAYSQPLCTPSRVQMMTGKYNYKNYSQFGHLNQDQKTFAHLAKEAGYATAIAGKWQLGANQKLPKHFGFDQYCLWQLSKPRREGERYAKPLIDKDGEILKTTDDDYGPDIFTDYLLDFIQKNKDGKFLAYYPMALVHDPFPPTPDSKSWKENPAGHHKSDTLNFRDMVRYCDKNVGKIVQKLKELGIYDNTIIIFTGDNGTGRAISTTMKDGSSVKGGKGLTIDRGHHVPLVINWGKYRYQKHELDHLFDFTDVMPTLADAMQVKVPKAWDTDGHTILPLLTNQKYTPREWAFTHYSPVHTEGINKQAARYFFGHRYKLYSDGRFFNLKNDPEQTKNIPVGQAGPEGEKARKLYQAQMNKLPAWKYGDAPVAKVVLAGLEDEPGFAGSGE